MRLGAAITLNLLAWANQDIQGQSDEYTPERQRKGCTRPGSTCRPSCFGSHPLANTRAPAAPAPPAPSPGGRAARPSATRRPSAPRSAAHARTHAPATRTCKKSARTTITPCSLLLQPSCRRLPLPPQAGAQAGEARQQPARSRAACPQRNGSAPGRGPCARPRRTCSRSPAPPLRWARAAQRTGPHTRHTREQRQGGRCARAG